MVKKSGLKLSSLTLTLTCNNFQCHKINNKEKQTKSNDKNKQI